MKKLLAPAVLIGVLALAGCGTSSDPKQDAPPASSAVAKPEPSAATPSSDPKGELVDGAKFFEDLPEDSYEENGYDYALPPIEVHSDENSGVDLDGIIIKLKAAERIPSDKVTGITDSYEGYDGLTPIRLTFTLEAQKLGGEDDQDAFPLDGMDLSGFYGSNLQPVKQYSELEDNDDGPTLDSEDPRQVAVGSPYDLMRTLWVPDEHADGDLMAEIALADDALYVDYFISGDQITDL